VINVIKNNTPVTSAIFLCELTWIPFLDEANDRRLPTDVVASPTLVQRHAPANQPPPPPRRWNTATNFLRRSPKRLSIGKVACVRSSRSLPGHADDDLAWIIPQGS
jgi:hypothetical protein